LLYENHHADYAYIIRTGECKEVMHKHPSDKEVLASSSGFMSRTTNCINFGLLAEGQWVGDDSIVLNEPMLYSVIATTYVTALRISRTKLLEGFHRDILNGILANVKEKIKWRKTRAQKLKEVANGKILKDDNSKYEKTLKHSQKTYPIASKKATENIRKLEL